MQYANASCICRIQWLRLSKSSGCNPTCCKHQPLIVRTVGKHPTIWLESWIVDVHRKKYHVIQLVSRLRKTASDLKHGNLDMWKSTKSDLKRKDKWQEVHENASSAQHRSTYGIFTIYVQAKQLIQTKSWQGSSSSFSFWDKTSLNQVTQINVHHVSSPSKCCPSGCHLCLIASCFNPNKKLGEFTLPSFNFFTNQGRQLLGNTFGRYPFLIPSHNGLGVHQLPLAKSLCFLMTYPQSFTVGDLQLFWKLMEGLPQRDICCLDQWVIWMMDDGWMKMYEFLRDSSPDVTNFARF